MTELSKLVAAALLLGAIALGGCASRLPAPDYESLEEPPSPEVVEQWEARRRVLVRAAEGGEFTLREFEEAVRFFEAVTGLPGHQDSTPYGLLPNDRLPSDLQSWDDWFRSNGAGLQAEELP